MLRPLLLMCVLLTALSCKTSGQGPQPRPAAVKAGDVKDVRPDAFCITCGALRAQPDGRTLVESPKMRALVDHMTGDAVELQFTYLGATRQTMLLSSGLPRTQVGLKLFAHDACNLAYVMWRLSPEPGVVVSIKRNANMHTSQDCDNRGYTNIRPQQHAAPPKVEVGVPHRLRVARDGATLSVYADELLVWRGTLPTSVPDEMVGFVGIRSDNGRYILKLALDDKHAAGTWEGALPTCHATGRDRDQDFPFQEE